MQEKQDFFIKEIEVNLVNKTSNPVYLNREFTPGGVLLTRGITWVDGDEFYVVARTPEPLKVTIKSAEWGRRVNRWSQELARGQYRLAGTGQACGLARMRGFNSDNIAHVTVLVENA